MGRGLMHPSLAACPWGLLHLRGHFPAAGKDPHQGLWLTTHWTGACCVLGLGQESGTATAGATASHRARGREEKGFPLRKGDAAACRAREVWGRRTCRQPGLKDRPDLGRAAQHGSWRDELAYRPACRHGADGEGRGGRREERTEKKKKKSTYKAVEHRAGDAAWQTHVHFQRRQLGWAHARSISFLGPFAAASSGSRALAQGFPQPPRASAKGRSIPAAGSPSRCRARLR